MPTLRLIYLPEHQYHDEMQNDVIMHAGHHDVIFGRGRKVNFHKGNVYFRKLVSVLRNEYVATPKSEKPFFAKMVQEHIRSLNPPGRFLKRDSKADPYVDVGEKPSIDKTSQALREGKPAIEKKIKSGEWIIENFDMRTLIEERARKVYSEVFPELTAATARDVRNGGGAPFLPNNAGYNSYEIRASNASSISHPILSKNNGNPHMMNSHGMTAASINSSNCTPHTFNSLGMQKSSVSSSNCTNNTVNSQGMRASVNSSNFTSSDDEESQNDSTSSPVHLDAIQQKPGQKRKRTAPTHSFDYRFNYLMAFKAKYGHCNVSQHGKDASLGKWCDNMRVSYTNIKNNQKPETKLSDEQIQRLSDAGFKWFLRGFDDHFNDLMAFKAGFKWCLQKKERELSLIKAFYDHFNDLMAFKAKYGHCDVSTRGEDASLGRWCSVVRGSYKKIQNNQNPKMKLSDEQIQRLNDAGFKWCL